MQAILPELSRRDRRRTETKEKLFEAAMALISERDFDHVTIEMITERADVGKGTFFNYFDTKEAVIAYFFESQLKLAREAIGQDERPASWDQIMRVIHLLAERDASSKRMVRTLMSLCLTNERVREAKDKLDCVGTDLGRRMVASAQSSGSLRSDVPASRLIDCIVGTYLGALFNWANGPSEFSLHEELDFRFSLLREGLRGETE